jgi:hypothetical protein
MIFISYNNGTFSTFCPHNVCVYLYGSQSKQQLFTYTAISCLVFFYNRDGVFTTRYGLGL